MTNIFKINAMTVRLIAREKKKKHYTPSPPTKPRKLNVFRYFSLFSRSLKFLIYVRFYNIESTSYRNQYIEIRWKKHARTHVRASELIFGRVKSLNRVSKSG